MPDCREAAHVQARKTTRREAGGCNFCSPSRHYDVVYEVSSNSGHGGGTVVVRFCRSCLKILKGVVL